MRVALYHNLPAGGALRAVSEFVRRLPKEVACDVFSIDFSRSNTRKLAPATTGLLFPFANGSVHSLPLTAKMGCHPDLSALNKLELLAALRPTEKLIADQINDGSYDVAYIHPCWASQTPSILRDLTLPSVYYMHEVRRSTFESNYAVAHEPKGLRAHLGSLTARFVNDAYSRRDRLAAHSADYIACNSYYSAESIMRAYGRSSTVAYLGVDTRTFHKTATARPSRKFVMSVGGLEDFKGHEHIVRAVSSIPAADRPSLCVVYERVSEPYRARLLDLSDRLGVEVTERRGVSDEALAMLYSQASATVLAATLEPFGLVALESMACGTPVVAFREAGYRETVIDGVNGFLVDRSVEALAEGIRRVLDKGLCATADDIRDTVLTSWTWDTAIARQVDILSRAAAGR